jgi:MHS family proline/betaine transporter-like MFS transporter
MHNSLPQWFWRIPFLLGGIICFVALYLRNKVEEPIAPVTHQHVPILMILKKYPLSLLTCVFIGGTSTVPFYIILTFINSSLMTAHVITLTEMMFINAFLQLACIFSLPLMRHLGDKFGLEKMM